MEKLEKSKIFLDYDGVVNNLIFHTIDGEPDFYYRSLNEYSGLDRHDHGLINFMYIKYETLNCILKGTIHRTVFRNFVYMKFEL